MVEREEFWDIVFDDRDDKKIKRAARELNSIQVVEVVTFLATELNRLRDENEEMKEVLSHAVIINGGEMN